MRYIYYIIAILLIISALLGYLLLPAKPPAKKAALIINGKIITSDEFASLSSSQSVRPVDEEGFINSLITRELLIQESQKEGIDREESFRKAIQNFYEQSLIKILMDRKFSSLQVSVSDDELNSYLSLLNKKMHLTLFSFSSLEEAAKGNLKNGEQKTLYLEDLSCDLRAPVSSLKVGDHTGPIRTGGGYVVVRLDKLDSLSPRPSGPDREGLRKMLTEDKREKMINNWIADLRKKATVKILIKQ